MCHYQCRQRHSAEDKSRTVEKQQRHMETEKHRGAERRKGWGGGDGEITFHNGDENVPRVYFSSLFPGPLILRVSGPVDRVGYPKNKIPKRDSEGRVQSGYGIVVAIKIPTSEIYPVVWRSQRRSSYYRKYRSRYLAQR